MADGNNEFHSDVAGEAQFKSLEIQDLSVRRLRVAEVIRALQERFSVSSTSGSSISGDCIEIGNHFRGNLKSRSLKILAKMLD